MVIWTVKLPQRKHCILAGALALLLLVGILSFASGRARSSDALAQQEDTLVLCLDCLEGFGWEVAPTPVSTEDFTLDSQLSQEYLALQQEEPGCWWIFWCGMESLWGVMFAPAGWKVFFTA